MNIKIAWILSLLIDLPAILDASPIQPGCLLQVSNSSALSPAASELSSPCSLSLSIDSLSQQAMDGTLETATGAIHLATATTLSDRNRFITRKA
jgi:hypothetical protein